MNIKRYKFCECGCGAFCNNKFVHGHNRKGLITLESTKKLMSMAQKGRIRTDEHSKNIKLGMKKSGAGEKISKAMMGNKNGIGAYHSPESIERVRQIHLGSKRSKENKEKLSRATKAHWNSLSDKQQEQRIAPFIKAGLNSGKLGPTSIELIMQAIFDKFDIKYETQKPIGKYLVDIYLPAYNLVVECDGDYWHNREGAKEKDNFRDDFMIKKGYKIKRLTETRIRKLAIIHNVIGN